MLGIICTTLLTPSGCRTAPAGHYRDFMPKEKEFMCEIPSDWKVREVKGYLLDISSPYKAEMVSANL